MIEICYYVYVCFVRCGDIFVGVVSVLLCGEMGEGSVEFARFDGISVRFELRFIVLF